MDQNKILGEVKTIAIIGLSEDSEKYSHKVGAYLQSQGYKIIPVNPNISETLGEKAFPNLLSIPKSVKVDIADIFRKNEFVFFHVKEAVRRGDIKTVWMQEGIADNKAQKYAQAHGLTVIMNSCLMKFIKNGKSLDKKLY